ncbi:MAG: metal-dependent hydrolase [Promethearchaeota archaeon]
MNEFTHVLTGFLVGRGFKFKSRRFESFYTGLAGLIPDFDFLFAHFMPGFEHGVATHTLIGGSLIALVYACIAWLGCMLFSKDFKMENALTFTKLLGLAMLGMLSHLVLDSFTFYNSYASDGTHHVYFWPFWDFPFHINTMFPAATYEIRVWVEVIYTVAISTYILLHLWLAKKENPFIAFSPWHWTGKVARISKGRKEKTGHKVAVVLASLGPALCGVFLLDFVSGILILFAILVLIYNLDQFLKKKGGSDGH